MKINEISKLNFIENVSKVKKTKTVEKEKGTDQVVLSREAKALSKNSGSLTPERIAEITKRIQENYYDRDEVLKAVAERILQSPQFRDILQGGRFDKNI